jgi:tetratricopeptide (TPR) repeat protein
MRPNIIAIALLFGSLAAIPAHAELRWQTLKHRGEVEDLAQRYSVAVPLFEQALKLIPPNDEHAILQTQCCLSGDLLRLEAWPRAGAEVEFALTLAAKLRSAGQLRSDDLLALNEMSECCERFALPHETYALRLERNLRNQKLKVRIMDFINPSNYRLFKMHVGLARSYIINGKAQEAAHELLRTQELAKQYSWKLSVSEKKSLDINEAAVHEVLGGKHAFDCLKQTLKTETEPERLCDIAEGEMWAVNYLAAENTFNQALAADKLHKGTSGMPERVYRTLATLQMERAKYNLAEPWLKRWVAELERAKAKSTDIFAAKHLLASCLRAENKMGEADRVMPKETGSDGQGLKEWEWILTDQEKSAAAKSNSGRRPVPPSH